MKLAVLARIPALNIGTHEDSRGELPTSKGRLINQALSFKLLAGATFLFAVAAILPFTLSRGSQSRPSSDSSRPSDALAEWQPSPSAQLPSTSTPALATAVAPPTEVACESASPASTGAPLMSPWPNPAHPTLSPTEARFEQPPAGVNQAMAIRPSLH